MQNTLLLDPIQILYDSNQSLTKDAVLIKAGEIQAFGEKARKIAKQERIHTESADKKLIAPCLVDPHSILIDPINGRNENLNSLISKASNAGYGQLALLPNGKVWRDTPDSIVTLCQNKSDVLIHLLGSFSLGGKGKELSPHADLLEHGAIGIAESDGIPPMELLRKGLLLNEIGRQPIFLTPRDPNIQGSGIVREGVDTLRAGWNPDPIESESLPLSQLLELQKQYPSSSIRLMNISTATGVSLLESSLPKTMASVCWWNLIKDNSNLSPTETGWRVIPSLGTPEDRAKLIGGLLKRVLTAVSVNSISLDDSEIQRPIDQRLPGISGYSLVLPLLWQELIVHSGWKVEELWEVLSFAPSKMLKVPEESLRLGSNRWLIFDPNEKWVQKIDKQQSQIAFNQPLEGKEITGKIVKSGIMNPEIQSG